MELVKRRLADPQIITVNVGEEVRQLHDEIT